MDRCKTESKEFMYCKEYYPDQFFSRYIDSYFTVDTSLVYEDITDIVVPDGTFGLLFIDSQNSIKRNTSTEGQPITLGRTSLFGQRTKPVNYYYSPGKTTSFGIKINPEGFPLFLDYSYKELNNIFVGLDGIADRGLMELEEQVFEQPSVKGKIKVVESFLLKRIVKLNSDDDYMLYSAIVEYIKIKKGEIRSNVLAAHFNINYKKMERLFKFYMGIAPKTYIRIIRFNAAIHLRGQLTDLNLTQLGNELGFFDQSHFIREFKSFSSLTPKDFFGKKLSSSEEVLMGIIAQRWS
ncbi:AraC family transcriptional regulator [Muricauda sp. CAU 1633]|uniref:helix-turn-helix domain-containing protein n=1 Tax=Allomuricauda sp. CAU 1633 TaxID=2816036 RepID=UPI001A8D81C3|nr:helix-turn-helix domain-containing protein [Muricauda sp. CAU 1633]MBO0323007.1 AraC family transcriptional regulator [Muricauda sp. CAU 1633]